MSANTPTARADEPRWTVKDVAAYLQCSTSKIYKAAEVGTLPAVRLGGHLRFDPDLVRAFARGELKRRPGGTLVRLTGPGGING